MRVLWITSSDTFYNQGDTITNSYNGVGWVASQQLEMMKHPEIELGIMFYAKGKKLVNREVDGVRYYPISYNPSRFAKLREYYGNDINEIFDRVGDQIDRAIKDFKPDIIHVFGLENALSNVIEKYDIPHVVHIQGLLIPYKTAFFPSMISPESVNHYGSFVREKILRNGFNFAYRKIVAGADREKKLTKHLRHCMGRTEWDRNLMSLYAPQSEYRHINEILRPEFYEADFISVKKDITCLHIVSTISNTIYKGLDLILNTCKVLEEIGIDYKWHIVGITPNSEYEKILRKELRLHEPFNIVYEGICSASQIVEILRSADCYVHPSYIDNSPNSLCEAQLLGLPVIATNVGGVSSLINDNEDGILVPANDPYTLSANLIKVKNNFDFRKNLSSSGRKNALVRHNKDEIINNILTYYKNLI